MLGYGWDFKYQQIPTQTKLKFNYTDLQQRGKKKHNISPLLKDLNLYGNICKIKCLRKIVSDDLARNNYDLKTDCKYKEKQIKLGHDVEEVCNESNCFIFNILFSAAPRGLAAGSLGSNPCPRKLNCCKPDPVCVCACLHVCCL